VAYSLLCYHLKRRLLDAMEALQALAIERIAQGGGERICAPLAIPSIIWCRSSARGLCWSACGGA
jgi:hypothetical protein